MVGLLDEALEMQEQTQTGPKCTVHKILSKLSDEEADEVRELIDSDFSHVIVSTVLRKRDIYISEHTLTRHRRGRCRCNGR